MSSTSKHFFFFLCFAVPSVTVRALHYNPPPPGCDAFPPYERRPHDSEQIPQAEDRYDLYLENKSWEKAAEVAARLKDPRYSVCHFFRAPVLFTACTGNETVLYFLVLRRSRYKYVLPQSCYAMVTYFPMLLYLLEHATLM